MTQGAPDYTHLRQILARDADGNLVPVACDPSGRIILLPYGTQSVSQDDPLRTIQGADGEDLYTIAVDAAGRLIMLPYGWDGVTYRPLKVDDEGRMIGVMKGQADVKWGLRGWWKFVAAEGTTIKDYSGYGFDGVSYSGGGLGADYTDGVIGQCLRFNGDDAYVLTTFNPHDELGEGDFTIEAWIKGYKANGGIVMGEGCVAANRWYFRTEALVGDTGKLRLAVGATTVLSTITYDVTTWQHVLVTFDASASEGRLYINGGTPEVLDFTGWDANSYCDNVVTIGRTAWAYYEGLIDEVRIYARVLSPDEVSWRYANTNPAVGKPTRMIAVDNEGRMEVNLKDLPYKAQVLEQEIVTSAGGAAVSISTTTVPEGKIWVITKAIAYTDTAALDSIDIGIYDGVDNYILAACREVDSCIKIETNNDMILKAGDKISAGFGGLPANWVVGIVINGYELDAP